MNTREQIITFLLQQDDANKNTIAQLQTQIAELQKRLAASATQDSPAKA